MNNPSDTLTETEIARLSEREALQRLELLATVSGVLAEASEDYDDAMLDVAGACVPAKAANGRTNRAPAAPASSSGIA